MTPSGTSISLFFYINKKFNPTLQTQKRKEKEITKKLAIALHDIIFEETVRKMFYAAHQNDERVFL